MDIVDLQERATDGDAEAIKALINAYENGIGVEKNTEIAAQWRDELKKLTSEEGNEPDYPSDSDSLSMILESRDRWIKGEYGKLMQVILRLDYGDDPYAQVALGDKLWNADPEGAFDCYKRAISLLSAYPDNELINHDLYNLLVSLGDKYNAKNDFEKALNMFRQGHELSSDKTSRIASLRLLDLYVNHYDDDSEEHEESYISFRDDDIKRIVRDLLEFNKLDFPILFDIALDLAVYGDYTNCGYAAQRILLLPDINDHPEERVCADIFLYYAEMENNQNLIPDYKSVHKEAEKYASNAFVDILRACILYAPEDNYQEKTSEEYESILQNLQEQVNVYNCAIDELAELDIPAIPKRYHILNDQRDILVGQIDDITTKLAEVKKVEDKTPAESKPVQIPADSEALQQILQSRDNWKNNEYDKKMSIVLSTDTGNPYAQIVCGDKLWNVNSNDAYNYYYRAISIFRDYIDNDVINHDLYDLLIFLGDKFFAINDSNKALNIFDQARNLVSDKTNGMASLRLLDYYCLRSEKQDNALIGKLVADLTACNELNFPMLFDMAFDLNVYGDKTNSGYAAQRILLLPDINDHPEERVCADMFLCLADMGNDQNIIPKYDAVNEEAEKFAGNGFVDVLRAYMLEIPKEADGQNKTSEEYALILEILQKQSKIYDCAIDELAKLNILAMPRHYQILDDKRKELLERIEDISGKLTALKKKKENAEREAAEKAAEQKSIKLKKAKKYFIPGILIFAALLIMILIFRDDIQDVFSSQQSTNTSERSDSGETSSGEIYGTEIDPSTNDSGNTSASETVSSSEASSRQTVTVLVDRLNIRTEPSRSSKSLGHAERGAVYEYISTVDNEGYTWYQLTDGNWIADKNGDYLAQSEN